MVTPCELAELSEAFFLVTLWSQTFGPLARLTSHCHRTASLGLFTVEPR